VFSLLALQLRPSARDEVEVGVVVAAADRAAEPEMPVAHRLV
jgi:hypothetical protein